MPTRLHEAMKKGIIFEEEIQGSKQGDKTFNPIVHPFQGKPTRRMGWAGDEGINHKVGASHQHGFQKSHYYKNHKEYSYHQFQ
jgi:hypothetical protein